MNFKKIIMVISIASLFLFILIGTSYAISDPTSLDQYSVSGGTETPLPVDSWTSSNQIKLEATKPAGWISGFPPTFVTTRLQFEIYKRSGIFSSTLYNTYDSPFSFIGESQSTTDTYPDGSYTWRVRAVSSPLAQESDWVYYPSTLFQDDFNVDTTPPTGSISINGGAEYTNNSTVNLQLTANDSGVGNSGLKMQVYNECTGPFLCLLFPPDPFSSPINNWPLTSGEGVKKVLVKYQDNLGNTMPSAINDTIIVDKTAPTVVINSGPTGAITNNSASFTYSGSDGSGSGNLTYAYHLDGGSWSAYSNSTSANYANLAAGNHTFEVKSKDAAGNESSTASRSFSYSPPQIIPPANTTPPKVKKTVATKHHKKVCAKNKKYHAKHCKSVAKNRKKTSANKKFHKKKCTKVIVT